MNYSTVIQFYFLAVDQLSVKKMKGKIKGNNSRKVADKEPVIIDPLVFRRVKRERLSERISKVIEEMIISGVFEIGSRLPSEQVLAEQFGVSRNPVREALKILQERGLIEIRNGSGAYVSQPDSCLTSEALGRYLRLSGINSSIKALYEVRRTLEGTIAKLAAERANSEDLVNLAACLTRMQQHAGSIEKWTEADLDFHLAVAGATHNPFFTILLKPLVEQLRTVIAEGYLVPGAIDTGLEAHTRLYNCIKNRDSNGAYEIIMTHLQDSEARVRTYKERRRDKRRSSEGQLS